MAKLSKRSIRKVPVVDKYIKDFLGVLFPNAVDAELARIQAAVLKSVNLLTDSEEADGLDLVVPVSQVLILIQHTICLVGNASEIISQVRHSKILELCNSSWAKY